MFSLVATQLVGTVSVSASGTEYIDPVKSNSPFSDLVIQVKPMELDDVAYTVAVYFSGELSEHHSYPDENDRVIANMSYPLLFPANIGTNAIPKFYDPSKKDFTGNIVRVGITNNAATLRTFEVYALFKAWDSCRFGVINQNT